MNAQSPGRGAELVAGGRGIGIGPQWLARAWSGSLHRLLDRIDAGLLRGSVELVLPDGQVRLLGGRASGFEARAVLHSARALLRLGTGGSVGCYQGWEAGEWESSDPVQLFALFVDNAAALGGSARAHGPWRIIARMLHWLHRNTRRGAERNIHAHYDLGNDFYAQWLDPSMSYSSAIFEAGHGSLEQGQALKLERIGKRLGLNGGEEVLEIGCGWGTLARRLERQHNAKVTAISLSRAQLAYARKRAAEEQLSTDFRHQDYRDVTGQFDAVASVEMVEAVGQHYWPDFFDCIARCLKPGGRAAIQYIAMRDDLFEAYARSADFIQTYIFPGGMLVRESGFRRLAAERGLGWRDQVDFGLDYAETLRLWRGNFERAVEEGRLPEGFDARFVQLWRFYLMYCEGGFRGRGIEVSQVTLVKEG